MAERDRLAYVLMQTAQRVLTAERLFEECPRDSMDRTVFTPTSRMEFVGALVGLAEALDAMSQAVER